jgi:hypothetical protein
MGNLFDELRRVFPHVAAQTCRKTGHLTREAAEAQRTSLLASPDCKDASSLRVYRCPNCNQFHVGHHKEERANEPVRDAAGREIAPAQDDYERPAGPWDSNEEG